jgi:CubicO group peptidase (beta-lactamase class C family)
MEHGDSGFSNEDRRHFLKQMGIFVIGTGMFSESSQNLLVLPSRRKSLPRSSPESQGVSSSEILEFILEAEKRNAGLHSVMIIRHGRVVAEGWWAPYQADIKHGLFSLSKNFTATAIGLAIQEGKLSLEDKVVSFFPEDLPEKVDENLAAMRVRDLITMSGGHGSDTLFPLLNTKSGTWAKTFLSIPLKYKAGTRFVYNTGSTYMLSAIITKVTGQPMIDYLRPRLFEPLGIEGANWDSDPQGISFGGAGLRLKTEDIAKFGQLYLQKGLWNGKRILSEKWVDEATSFQIANDETGTPTKKEEDDIKQGYGYQFWLSRPVAQGAYRSEGAFCQYSIVMPKQDAVIAITAEGISTKRVMDLCWDILLPAMKDGLLPANLPAEKKLTEKLKSLKLVPPQSKPNSIISNSVSGKIYKIESNTSNIENISFYFEKDLTVFTLRDNKSEYRIKCGLGAWILSETCIPGSPTNLLGAGIPLPQTTWKIAASGTWTNESTYVMTWRFFESPHFDIVTCKFNKNELLVVYANSITRILKQYNDPRPTLKGLATT